MSQFNASGTRTSTANDLIGRNPLWVQTDSSDTRPGSGALADQFERVERAKQEWEATADALPDLICLLDAQGLVIRANRIVETWQLGRVTSVQGLSLHTLLHADCMDDSCSVLQFLRQAAVQIAHRQPAEFETYDPFVRRHLHFRLRPVSVPNMHGPSAVAVVEDVTDRQQIEEKLLRYTERLEALNLIEKSILAARSCDEIAQGALSRAKHLVPFHQARLTLFDAELDTFYVVTADTNGETHLRPGQTLPSLMFNSQDERRPENFVFVADLLNLRNLTALEQELAADHMRSYFSIPMIAEDRFIGSFTCASRLPNAFGQDHIEIGHELADLLAIASRQTQLVQKLTRTNAQLEEALRAKEQMLQNVSHELRTPLGLIYGYTAMLESGDLGTLAGDQQRAVEVMLEQEERLRFMVDRLITLRTLERGDLHLAPFDLEGWLPQVIASWDRRLGRAGVQLSLNILTALPRIEASPDHLKQVIDNLIHNALKFSPKHGQVAVCARAEAQQVIVSVSDNGIGIPLNKVKQVFERFYQVDGSATRQFGGMGIGLALCQAIVAAHGGRIWVESAGEGQGSTFYIALPLDKEG
jgi:signal transduction histidine kinase